MICSRQLARVTPNYSARTLLRTTGCLRVLRLKSSCEKFNHLWLNQHSGVFFTLLASIYLLITTVIATLTLLLTRRQDAHRSCGSWDLRASHLSADLAQASALLSILTCRIATVARMNRRPLIVAGHAARTGTRQCFASISSSLDCSSPSDLVTPLCAGRLSLSCVSDSLLRELLSISQDHCSSGVLTAKVARLNSLCLSAEEPAGVTASFLPHPQLMKRTLATTKTMIHPIKNNVNRQTVDNYE